MCTLYQPYPSHTKPKKDRSDNEKEKKRDYPLPLNCSATTSPNVLLCLACCAFPVSPANMPVASPSPAPLSLSLSASNLALSPSKPLESRFSSPTIHPGTRQRVAPGSKSRRYAVPTPQPMAAASKEPGNCEKASCKAGR